jgi:SAM-dependent methyltransferase
MNPPHDDVRAHRDWLLSFIHLPPGGTAVDLGCGTGADLLALAARHADPGARFLGVDASETLLSLGAAAAGDPRVAFCLQRISGRLPLADGSVDAVYSHNLLECLADRDAFAREVHRILRPGGVAVIAHWDFDSQVLDATDKDAVRRLVHAFADWKQRWMDHADGWMGRRLWGVFAGTGLFDGAVHARVMTNTTYAEPWYGHARVQDFAGLVRKGLARAEDVESVVRDLERLDREGRYFYGITGYAYVGRRRDSAESTRGESGRPRTGADPVPLPGAPGAVIPNRRGSGSVSGGSRENPAKCGDPGGPVSALPGLRALGASAARTWFGLSGTVAYASRMAAGSPRPAIPAASGQA